MTSPDNFSFKVLCEDGPARIGKINCAHGLIETPAFMPVGTAGTVKAMTPTEIARCAELQAAAVKLFPISAIGGPDYVRAIREIYPSLPLAPSGGIQIEDVHSYLNAGADFVGISSKLVDASDIAKRDSAAVYDRAAQVVGSLEGRQREHAAVA